MSRKWPNFVFLLLLALTFTVTATAQDETIVVDSLNKKYNKVIAGDYDRSGFYKFFMGKHYRKEWVTPVVARELKLDTTFGGLKPYEAGGGRQSKTLRLHDKNKREYVVRSLDKSFGRALPEIMRGTFIEDLIDDQVTIAHPYSAFTIPPMAEAAKIYHANPIMRYVPEQKALDTFNENFKNRLYLLEQRPDEDWATAPNFGNSKNIVSTEKLLEKLLEENDNRVDQALFVRSRLFDIFIGDWGRHDDQWRWASQKKDDHTLYQPVPRDRDQAYTKFDGIFPQMVLSAANVHHLQTFRENIENIKTYNYSARHLDRRMLNELSKEDWLRIAKELQQSLTDEVIRSAIKQMPPEVYPISGPEITEKLIARRDKLVEFASDYYDFLARHVNVVGSKEREYFEIRRLSNEETSVKIFVIEQNGKPEKTPYYSRVFKNSETKDVRIFGIDGNDVFDIDGNVDEGIKIRVIGGPVRDSIIDNSNVAHGTKTNIYDDKNNSFNTGHESNYHLSKDDSVHLYDYNEFKFHKRGPKASVFYDNPDRLYVGTGFGFKRHMWRKDPWGFEQAVYLRYSIAQNSFSIQYDGRFAQVAGKWNLRIQAIQDFIRWTNFYGLGNETKQTSTDRFYNRMQTNEFLGSLNLSRPIRKHHSIEITGFFSSVKVLDDSARFISDNIAPTLWDVYIRHNYVGARIGYNFQKVDDASVPQKGTMFYAGMAYTQNIKDANKNFITANSILQLYIPLVQKFSLSIRGGVTTVTGQPEFFQYASIGGSQTLRGYRRDRFWGQTAFYNTNELRWITDIKTYLMNGKAGFLAFIDDGRVWMPGENSTKWHMGYGGGIILAPFNLATASITYGISDEGGRVHIGLRRLLK